MSSNTVILCSTVFHMFDRFKRDMLQHNYDILIEGPLIGKDRALRKRLGGHGKPSEWEFLGQCLSSEAINPSQAASNHLVNKTLKQAFSPLRDRRCNQWIVTHLPNQMHSESSSIRMKSESSQLPWIAIIYIRMNCEPPQPDAK